MIEKNSQKEYFPSVVLLNFALFFQRLTKYSPIIVYTGNGTTAINSDGSAFKLMILKAWR